MSPLTWPGMMTLWMPGGRVFNRLPIQSAGISAATEIGMTSIKGIKLAVSASSSTCRRRADSARRPVRKSKVGLTNLDLTRLEMSDA